MNKYRSEQSSKSNLGTKFEELMVRYLRTDPVYSEKIDKAYLWSRFPFRSQLGGHDTGIDESVKLAKNGVCDLALDNIDSKLKEKFIKEFVLRKNDPVEVENIIIVTNLTYLNDVPSKNLFIQPVA
ncbi:MAG: hypothetical protein LBJ20_07245 [Candidatus Methanoplasma sp.]|nr:hypothetical protein [Candidatus Methanoplasma sp.]